MKALRALPALLALLALGSCATSPTGRPQLMLVSDSQMAQMGVASFNQLKQQGKFADAPKQKTYATCVAKALIGVLPAEWRNQQWDVEIIKDDTPNAFALPGGRIGVNQGMFAVANNQDLLAVVLGHELSHVVARHSAERFSDQTLVQGGIAALGAYGAATNNDSAKYMALLGLGAEVGILLPFSRAQESEADVMGQQFMAQAGFDPAAAVTLWQKMEKATQGSRTLTFLSTHPAPEDRMQTLADRAPALEPVYRQARRHGHDPNCGS